MRCLLIATLGVVLATTTLDAQYRMPPLDSIERHVDRVFERYTPKTPGCAVGIYRDGRVVLAKGYGSANLEYDVPITPTTPFIVGSVSKQFTAAAIALLAEEKRLSMDDDVRKYLPELPDYGRRITVAHLVHHTSGLRDWWALVDVAGMRYDDGYNVNDVMRLASRQKSLNFAPGERSLYSNTGYIAMGVIVQRVTGKTLRQFAQERLFDPLGMTATHFHDDHTMIVPGRAAAYSPISGGGYRVNVWNNDLVGQGGVITTALDLLKWDENFYRPTVGGPAFVARQLQRGTLNSGTILDYAYGLTHLTYRNLAVVEHSGSTGGYRAVITRYPDLHTSFVALCNVSTADPTALLRRVADFALRERLGPAAPVRAAGSSGPRQTSDTTTISLDPALLESFAGRFYSEELEAEYQLAVANGRLLLHRSRAAADTLRARAGGRFVGTIGTLNFGTGSRTSFILDAGRVEGIVFTRRQ